MKKMPFARELTLKGAPLQGEMHGEAGKVQMINNYSVLQAEPRRMPNFFMVAPSKEG
jgi:hypothetical protein